MSRTPGARPVMRMEIAAAVRLRDRHCLSWREIGRILRRDHSTIRKAMKRAKQPNMDATL